MNKLKYIQLSITFLAILVLVACQSATPKNERFDNLLIQQKGGTYSFDTNYVEQLARNHVINGSKFQQQNLHAQAILEFQQAARYDKNPAIYYAMAKSYLAIQNFDIALENVTEALRLSPEFLPAIELLAEVYLYKFEISNAIIAVERYIELNPTREKKYSLAGLYEISNPNKAILLYEELLAEYKDPHIMNRLSMLYEKSDNPELQLKSIEQIFEVEPTNIRNAVSLVDFYLEEKYYDKLLKSLDVLDRNYINEDLGMFYGIISTYMLSMPDEEVNEFLVKFVNRIDNRFYFDWRLNMLKIFLADKISDFELVDTTIVHTLKLVDPANSELPIQLAFYYMRKDEIEKALNIFNDFEEFYQDDWRFVYTKAIAHISANQFDEAKNDLLRAYTIDSEQVDVVTQLGFVYDRLGDIDKSDEYYIKALEIEPENPMVNNNYAYSLAVRGIKLREALFMSQKAIDYDPTNVAYLDTYGWILYQMGDYNEALRYISKAVATGFATAEVYENLGMVFLQLQQELNALEAFNKAIELEPEREENLNQYIKKLKE